MATIVVRKITVIQFAVCVLLGALLWIASPYITGQREAWDSGFYYTGGLLFMGFVGGVLDPPRCWLAPVGLFVGQVFPFMISIVASAHPGPLWPLGLFVGLPMYSVVSLFGACLGAGGGILIRGVLRRIRDVQPSAGGNAAPPRASA